MARKPGANRMGGGRVSSGSGDGKGSGRGAAIGKQQAGSAADAAERRELWRELGLDDSDDESVGEVEDPSGGEPRSSPPQRRFVAVGGRGRGLGGVGASPAAKDIRGGGEDTDPLSEESEAAFKPKFERGARVYAAWWPNEDTERASSPSWYPGTVKDYEEVEVDVDEDQLVCTYSISFDDGDELDGLEQSHLMTKEDYFQLIKKEIKPIFEKGDEVYAAWWADDKRTAATPKWYPGVITKVHKSTHGATEFGPSMYYDVRFDDGDELDAIPESHVFNKEDYLLTMRFSKDGGEPKFSGVRNVTDKGSSDSWATLVGWYVASINGEEHPFSFLSDALRAYDAHVVSSGGSVKKSHLNLPEEHFSDPKSPPKVQQKPKAKKMTSRKSRRISAAIQSKLQVGSRVYVHQCKDGSKYKATVKKVGPGDAVKVHYDGMKKTSFYEVSLDLIKGFVEEDESVKLALEGNESKRAPSPVKSAPAQIQSKAVRQSTGSSGDNVKLLFELACQAVASKDTGDSLSLEENTERLLAASNRILTKALGMYKEKHEANAAKLLSNTKLFEAYKASLLPPGTGYNSEPPASPVVSSCAAVESPPSSTRTSVGVGNDPGGTELTDGGDFKVSAAVSSDRVGAGLDCVAPAKECVDSIGSEPNLTESGDAPVLNTGHWTAEEHRLFLQGLEQHGNEWQKIATLVKSRTVKQICSHADKHFKKLAKAAMQAKASEARQKAKLKQEAAKAMQVYRGQLQSRGTRQVSVQVTVTGLQVEEEVLAAAVPGNAVESKQSAKDQQVSETVELAAKQTAEVGTEQQQHRQPEESDALSEGWEELTVPSTGRKFYIDHTNKTTSWERPTCSYGSGAEKKVAGATADTVTAPATNGAKEDGLALTSDSIGAFLDTPQKGPERSSDAEPGTNSSQKRSVQPQTLPTDDTSSTCVNIASEFAMRDRILAAMPPQVRAAAEHHPDLVEKLIQEKDDPASWSALAGLHQPNAYGPVAFAGNSGAAMGMSPSRLDFLAAASRVHENFPLAPPPPMAFAPPPPMAFVPPQPWANSMANQERDLQNAYAFLEPFGGGHGSKPAKLTRFGLTSEQWNAMSEKKKLAYSERYEEDKKRYDEEMKADEASQYPSLQEGVSPQNAHAERPTGSDDSEPSCIRGGGGESDMAEAEAEMKRQMWYARRGVVLPRSSGQPEPTCSTAVDKAAASSLKAELERAHAGKRKATLSRMEQEAEHNTGRWTVEEHQLFLQGLEQHGMDWKKVATIVKSRTEKQIATHARKSVVELKQTNEKQATKTKQTHEVCDEQQSPEGSNTLPEGWEELTDPSTKRKFYVDHANEATTWERPIRSFSNSAEEEVVERIQHRGQFSQGACGEDLTKECAEVAEQFADSIEEPSSKRLKATGVAQQPNVHGPVAFAGNSGADMGMYLSRLDFLASASHFHYGCPMAPSRPMAFAPQQPMAFMPPQPWTMNMANHYPMWPDSAFRPYGVSEQWNAMGEATSGAYLDPYEEDKKRYEAEMKAYEEDETRYDARNEAVRVLHLGSCAAQVQQVRAATKKKATTKKKHERKQQTRVFRGHVDIAQKAEALAKEMETCKGPKASGRELIAASDAST
ncbi:hypothetical protein ACHAXT_007181 [Thalassiosira profunda]